MKIMIGIVMWKIRVGPVVCKQGEVATGIKMETLK